VEGTRAPPIIDGIESGHQPIRLTTVLGVEQIGPCLTRRDEARAHHVRLYVEIPASRGRSDSLKRRPDEAGGAVRHNRQRQRERVALLRPLFELVCGETHG